MTDPTDLLRQMAERSERKLRLPKNLAKRSWYGMDDFSVHQMVRDEIIETLLELGVKPVPLELIPDFPVNWTRVADEAQDVYAEASMGADPARRRAGTATWDALPCPDWCPYRDGPLRVPHIHISQSAREQVVPDREPTIIEFTAPARENPCGFPECEWNWDLIWAGRPHEGLSHPYQPSQSSANHPPHRADDLSDCDCDKRPV